ncbi:hypothetical protein SAMN05216191_101686, partial [Paenibacillus jilunlii]
MRGTNTFELGVYGQRSEMRGISTFEFGVFGL